MTKSEAGVMIPMDPAHAAALERRLDGLVDDERSKLEMESIRSGNGGKYSQQILREQVGKAIAADRDLWTFCVIKYLDRIGPL